MDKPDRSSGSKDQTNQSRPISTSSETKNMEMNIFDKNGKIFVKRKSMLARISKDSHISSMYNLMLSFFLFACITAIVHYVVLENKLGPPIHSYLQSWIVLEYERLVFSWFKLFVWSLFVYVISYLEYQSDMRFRVFWLGTYFLYQMNILIQTYAVIHRSHLSMVSKMILTVEEVRLTMKMYSFFRENLRLKDIDNRQFPGILHFLYFYFCPTSIYRDAYPRKRFNPVKTINYLFKCVSALIFAYILLEYYLIPRIQNLADSPLYIKNLVFEVLINSIPATLFFVSCIFYFYLHSFLNFWAELLMFGDRLFYLDWWNSISYGDFYKNWNIVVGDWLKTYLFYDTRGLFSNTFHNPLASVLVITFSSIIHEYILFMVIGSFCPVVSVTFGIIGLLLKFLKPNVNTPRKQRTWNFFFWMTFFLGNSINTTLYALEATLSTTCSVKINSVFDYFRPKFTMTRCYGAQT